MDLFDEIVLLILNYGVWEYNFATSIEVVHFLFLKQVYSVKARPHNLLV